MATKRIKGSLIATFVETPPSRIPYSAGVYDELTEYEGTATTSPYVIAGSNVYALNIIGKIKGVDPVQSVAKQDGIWSLLDKFKSLIADTAIINGAVIGGFAFYDGWFISQDGTDLQGKPSPDYKDFPLGTFIPNIQIHGKTGKIYALKGQFGLLHIQDSELIGKTAGGAEVMRITGKKVPNADLFNGEWVFIDRDGKFEREDFLFSNDSHGTEDVYRNTLEFSVVANKVGMYNVEEVLFQWRYKTTPKHEIALNELSLTYSVFRGQNKISSGYMENGSDLEFYADKTGIYEIEISVYARFYAVGTNVDRVYEGLVCDTGYRALSYKTTPQNLTYIGSDGLYTSFSSEEFLHYKANEGFILRSGNYGLRVSKSGIQKWNGNQWVVANI